MKSELLLLERIKEIKQDERLSYPPATISENAQLALVQLSLEIELHTLEFALDIPYTYIKDLQKEKN